MGKLFSFEDESETIEVLPEREPLSIAEEIEDHSDTLEIITEAFRTTSNEINLVTGIKTSLNSKERPSIDYFTSLENYTPVLSKISDNLGVKCRIPSLEDFKNPFGLEASHQVTMEGFYDYIKTIWNKAKEIFKAFFKKIGLFFRRLLNADLELEEYETYLEGMVAKLKATKPEISDSKAPIKSKLPAFLANEGVESVTSDYILSNGGVKIKYLSEVINNILISDIRKFSGNNLKNLSEKIKRLISEGVNVNDIEKTLDELESIKKEAIAGLEIIFNHRLDNIKELPDKVYNDIYHHFDNNEINDIIISSILDGNNRSMTLPKNFNSYFIVSETGQMFIGSSTELNTYVSDTVTPISNVNNLIQFYDNYKKFKSSVNIKNLDKAIESAEDSIDNIIDLMHDRYTKLLEQLATNKKNIASTGGDEFMMAIHMLHVYMKAQMATRNPTKMMDAARGISNTFPELEEIGDINADQHLDRVTTDIINTYSDDRESFISRVESFIGETIPRSSSSKELDKDELARLIKGYEDLQKFLLNYFNNLQVMLKDIAIELAGSYTELRYEIVKYIYNSAKLYNI